MSIEERREKSYKVFMTPLISEDVYGTEVEVTDFVLESGVGKIKKGIDATDYDYGIFFYGDISLRCKNFNGYFNDENDTRSIFTFTRDRAKVRVVYRDQTTSATDDTIIFNGLINEEATRLDIQKDEIKLRVLALDSVIRNNKVSAGAVGSGVTFKTAIETILNTPRITSVLNFSASNINPDLNLTIDVGSEFDNKPTREALNELLLASNSVMVIDDSQNMIVRSREEDTLKDVHNLHGANDFLGRENIKFINGYNTGRHRMFNSVRVNNTVSTDDDLAKEFGTRQKRVTLEFITDVTKEKQIADRLLKEFKVSKIELKIGIPTSVAKSLDIEIFDRVSVNYPLRIGAPEEGEFLPVIGQTKIGDADAPLPETFGSIAIDPNLAFKVIELNEDPRSFTTMLKLRQKGTLLNDGVFNEDTNCIVGFGVIGVCKIAGSGSESFNPSVIGAAKIGVTKVG